MSRTANAYKITSRDPSGPAPLATKRAQDRRTAKRYRDKITDRKTHSMPELVPVVVSGRSAWRAVHDNGMVQTVIGNKRDASRRVRAVVDRLNAFDAWCRRTPTHQRIELL
jgi:hypothetical protein